MDSSNGFLTGAARENAINHAGNIDRLAFQVNIGVFTGLAILTVIVRFVIRLHKLRALYLDDYLLIFGAACLVVALAMLYWYGRDLFLVEALNMMPTKVTLASLDELNSLFETNKIIQVFLAMIWTSTFAVKFSFLAFFKTLVWTKLSRRMAWYFWFVVVLTALSWGFVVSEGFILCPYFGTEAVKCFPNTPHVENIALTALVTVLDIVTDILVVSFPIIILHRANMNLSQKVGLGVFLSLSLVMAIIAIVRMVGSIRPGLKSLDVSWELFWQQMEGCIAIMMGSMSAFRTVFSGRGPVRARNVVADGGGLSPQDSEKGSSSLSRVRQLFAQKGQKRVSEGSSGEQSPA
ncbi:hypothetical protein BFW01_g9863 [Lasiodiplodia theobromae]|uniref:Integral membrane protein n=1 Tax=Lasiodiplodia theobromae TaxID=45133 RepID=UPI0015C32353|nr:Integral membrane protein [Lasiodiplodia theobromae]KAF4535087.1 Integral membrane protein [Lasiodiplodia theobromae]KAF9638966.1 hypothetical protein BFW01_g9863 [Lasiodiplodia theobromae]